MIKNWSQERHGNKATYLIPSWYAKFILLSYWQMSVITDMPSDAQRIQKVKLLIEAGYTDRILLAHDIHTKHRLVSGV